jgi:hypothetical protein
VAKRRVRGEEKNQFFAPLTRPAISRCPTLSLRERDSPREHPQQNHVKRPDGNGKRQLEFDYAIPIPQVQ